MEAAELAFGSRDLAVGVAPDEGRTAQGIGDHNRAFNLTWHDWMNLKSLVAVSRVITAAAIARQDSRGAHFRADFPESGPLDQSSFTSIRLEEEEVHIVMKPVAFTRVRPGQSLLENVA